MDPFVEQLAELCRTHVTRAKWVFVPSHALGWTIGERIALAGTSWLNLRFVTPLDIALRMGAPFLVERGIDPSGDGLGPALAMRLLLDQPQEGGYFRPLADRPAMAQALWLAVRELRMAGITAAEVERAAFTAPAKRRELAALLRAYERFLAEHRRGDMAAVYTEALDHPEWCPIQAHDCWTELPGVVWAPLERRLLDAMPGERIVPRTPAIEGALVPRRLEPQAVERVRPGESAPLARLLTVTPHPASAAIHLFHAGGREAEVDEVFRRILRSGAPLDHVEIACTSDAHAALIWEKALRHDWPATLAAGIPASHTRPGRALLGFCDWIAADFAAAHLRRLLQCGDVRVEREDDGFTAADAARVLGRADARWGRHTYGLALGRLRKRYETRAADPDESDESRADARAKADLAQRVLGWIDGLIASVPEPADGNRVSLQAIVAAASAFVERTTARMSALDHRARAALLDHVAELHALGSFTCTLDEALRFIRERVQTLRIAQDRPRPGHLFVSTLSQACLSGRPHLFVIGLEEGRVFPAATEDSILLDDEREALSPALRRSIDAVDEAVYALLSRLATWSAAGGGSATFSYSCRDTREFRETYASWVMLQAYRLQQGDPAATYRQMKAALGEPASAVPRDRALALAPGSWWLRSVAGTREKGVAVLTPFTGVRRGLAAQGARSDGRLTEYDGHVPEAGPLLDPCAGGQPLSVTELEHAAGCPFRFFLKHGLGLRPLDARERDRDVWLDPATRGAELHNLYAAALRRCRDEHRRPDRKTDGAWLRARADERLLELRREMPPPSDEVFDRERAEFLADVDLFIDAESRHTQSTPVGFEVSFGRPLDAPAEPLARAEPVTLQVAGGLRLTIAGRIDRIDHVRGAEYEVLDYKTGGFWPGDWTGVFNGGRRLQHALYGLAATSLLRQQDRDATVAAGVYYFPSRKGRRERVRIPAPSAADVAAVLRDLRDAVVSGAFVHAPRKDECRFCDYTRACDGSLEDRADSKLEDPALEPYLRLTRHE